MRSLWIRVLCLSVLIAVFAGETGAAKKPRSGKAASRTKATASSKKKRKNAKAISRKKAPKGRVAVRAKRGRKVTRSRRSRRRIQPTEAVTDPAVPRPAPGISGERATEIQNALIKAGYLDPPASGQYDDATIDAMKQFQASNRLPATGLPSAAALKKLNVPKRSNDGYAVPVKRVSENDKKRSP